MKQNVILLIVGLSVFTVANVYGQKADYGAKCVGQSQTVTEQCNDVKFFACSTDEAKTEGTCQCMPNYYKKAAEADADACVPSLGDGGNCAADKTVATVCQDAFFCKDLGGNSFQCKTKLAQGGDCSANNGACKADFTCTAGVCKANAGKACTKGADCAVANSACISSACQKCATGKVPDKAGTACEAAPAGTCGQKTCEADEECKENKCVKKNGSDVLQGPGFILLLVSLIVGTLASRG